MRRPELVPCPVCHVDVGQPCITPLAYRMPQPHTEAGRTGRRSHPDRARYHEWRRGLDDPDHPDDFDIYDQIEMLEEADALADERDQLEADEAERRICSDWFDEVDDDR